MRGNRDDYLPGLPEKRIIEAGSWRIGMIHGTRPRGEERADRLRYLLGDLSFMDERRFVRQAFAGETVHCIVFGHTHEVCQEMQDGVLLFNPGGVMRSPRGSPPSVGILEVGKNGIEPQVIRLRRPPHPLSTSEWLRARRSLGEPSE